MNITKVLTVLNQMTADGVIKDYAIGGAVGATFYLEPAATLDIDIFVHFEPEPGSLIITLKPIFDYLTTRGYQIQGEYIQIEGWPVQFLPPPGPLAEEALAQAVDTEVEGVPTRVFTAEHLVAIALQVGRAKDKARIVQFVEAGAVNSDRLDHILRQHNLLDSWRAFERLYFTP